MENRFGEPASRNRVNVMSVFSRVRLDEAWRGADLWGNRGKVANSQSPAFLSCISPARPLLTLSHRSTTRCTMGRPSTMSPALINWGLPHVVQYGTIKRTQGDEEAKNYKAAVLKEFDGKTDLCNPMDTVHGDTFEADVTPSKLREVRIMCPALAGPSVAGVSYQC